MASFRAVEMIILHKILVASFRAVEITLHKIYVAFFCAVHITDIVAVCLDTCMVERCILTFFFGGGGGDEFINKLNNSRV